MLMNKVTKMNANNHIVELKNGKKVTWDEFSTWSTKKQNFNTHHYGRLSEESIAKRTATKVATNTKNSSLLGSTIENRLSRRVMTPKGECDSINDAALLYGVVCQTISNWIRKGREGFAFITPARPRKKTIKAESVTKVVAKQNGRAPMAVLTPKGRFPNVNAAAEHYGVHPTRIYSWIKCFKPDEFKFEPNLDKVIVTPRGTFVGVRAAAEEFGITTHAMRSRISSPTWVEFRYAN